MTPSQLGKCFRKGFRIYVVQASYAKYNKAAPEFKNLPIIHDFMDVSLEKILGLPPRKDIDLTIELMPKETLVSKVPYRMSVPSLKDLKI